MRLHSARRAYGSKLAIRFATTSAAHITMNEQSAGVNPGPGVSARERSALS